MHKILIIKKKVRVKVVDAVDALINCLLVSYMYVIILWFFNNLDR